MKDSDKVFAGSIPAIYDRLMVPMLFEPYAIDMARRAAAVSPSRLLETAAGTGIVTQQLARSVPQDVQITATDLNPAMIAIASARVTAPNVTWQPCDATQLPFADHAFDAVVCQFGAMFFPDKRVAYQEARRVLRPGGTFLFSVWDSLGENQLTEVVAQTVAAAFPDNPPGFFARIPHGYFDSDAIRASLQAAGFGGIDIETVQMRSRARSALDAATGLCQGSPLRNEIEQRDASKLTAVTEAAARAIAARFGTAAIDVPMQALVMSARA